MNNLNMISYNRFELNVKSTSEYNGGSMYTDCKTIQLLLDGEVISEVSL